MVLIHNIIRFISVINFKFIKYTLSVHLEFKLVLLFMSSKLGCSYLKTCFNELYSYYLLVIYKIDLGVDIILYDIPLSKNIIYIVYMYLQIFII